MRFSACFPVSPALWLPLALLNAGCHQETTLPDGGDGTSQKSEIRLQTVDGEMIAPLAETGGKAAVFIFISNDCPVSNRYAPEIRRLHDLFSKQGIVFWLVHADSGESEEAIRTHAKAYDLPKTILLDREQRLVRRLEAKVTPEAVVVAPGGRTVYRGRIDNRYVDFGKARREPTERDLEEVLVAVAAGQPVAKRNAPAIGCYIPSLP